MMLCGVLGGAMPAPVCAQRANAAAVEQAAAPVTVAVSERSANDTRMELNDLLSDHPPSVREVLQRDPGLLENDAYLSAYPRLAAFVRAHPEIGRAPDFFLGKPGRNAPESATLRIWSELSSMISVGSVLLGFGLGLAWLVRTVLDHRRWQRVSKVQVETHTKILDRLTSSDDLRAYIESPAGRQFLESAPIALDGSTPPIAAPVNRILWSVQVGVVALFAGIALVLVGKTAPMGVQDGQPLAVLGTLLSAIGAGFLVSAAVSYVLSRHLGLLQSRTSQG